MKVKELISLLKDLPEEHEVCVEQKSFKGESCILPACKVITRDGRKYGWDKITIVLIK